MPGFDATDLDEMIHGRVRLGIMSYLVSASPAPFTELARTLSTTNGNLSVHLKKLEDAGYVSIEKSFSKNRPLTTVCVTSSGREAWSRYLKSLRLLFPDA